MEPEIAVAAVLYALIVLLIDVLINAVIVDMAVETAWFRNTISFANATWIAFVLSNVSLTMAPRIIDELEVEVDESMDLINEDITWLYKYHTYYSERNVVLTYFFTRLFAIKILIDSRK